MDSTRVEVAFCLEGDGFEPDEITARLGILPDSKWRKGEKITGKEILRRQSLWEITTGFQQSIVLDEQLAEIYNRIIPIKTLLGEVIERYELDVTLSIVICIENGKAPGIHFEKEMIELLNNLNAEIDIDSYVYS